MTKLTEDRRVAAWKLIKRAGEMCGGRINDGAPDHDKVNELLCAALAIQIAHARHLADVMYTEQAPVTWPVPSRTKTAKRIKTITEHF